MYKLNIGLLLFSFLSLISCKEKEAQKNTVFKISGVIENPTDSLFFILFDEENPTSIQITDGKFEFSDTISIPKMVSFRHGKEIGYLYLKPNYQIQLRLNTKEFDESLSFSGEGAGPNNFIIQNLLYEESNFPDPFALYSLNQESFLRKLDTLYTYKSEFLNKNKELINDDDFFLLKQALLPYTKANEKFNYPLYHYRLTKDEAILIQPFSYFSELVDLFEKENQSIENTTEYESIISNFISLQAMKTGDTIDMHAIYEPDFSEKEIIALHQFAPNNRIKSKLLLNHLKNFEMNGDYDNLLKYLAQYDSLSQDKSNLKKFELVINQMKSLEKGMPAPLFSYPNEEGKLVSSTDLKGKVIYLDVWATWCGPCKREIPFLKELEAKYHSKEIAFVSISVDEIEDKNTWLDFIKKNELKGIQLFASGWSDITKNYLINGIPRFILIDKEGNIIDANAPRPSSSEISTLLNEIL